jgi:N-methylhydantoinase B
VIAGSGGAPVWAQRFTGRRRNGRQFLFTCVSRGGLGARPDRDGVSTLAFPSNTNATPVEIIEGDGPVIYEKKELRQDSAGAGKYRGGFGQHVALRILEDDLAPGGHVIASAKGGRFHYPVPGILGGHDAPKGAIIANGEALQVSGKQLILSGGGEMELLIPGGGGYGDPFTRDLKLVEEDVRNGLISLEEARLSYGVIMDESGWNVDVNASERIRRAARRSSQPIYL